MNDVKSDAKIVFLNLDCMACYAISRMQANPTFAAEQAADMATVVALANVKHITFDVAVAHLCNFHRAEYDKLIIKTSGP